QQSLRSRSDLSVYQLGELRDSLRVGRQLIHVLSRSFDEVEESGLIVLPRQVTFAIGNIHLAFDSLQSGGRSLLWRQPYLRPPPLKQKGQMHAKRRLEVLRI